jgi:hypothetical protein
MSEVTVMFVFTDASQFQPLTGSSPGQGLSTPALVLMDGKGEVTISGTQLPSQVTIGGKSYDAYPTSDNVNTSPTVLTVLPGKKPNFQFNVQDSVNPPAGGFYLGGIALKTIPGAGGASKAGEAGDVFDAISVTVDANTGATTLKVQDNNKAPQGSSVSYKFWVMVQNASGDVSLIDPRIVNTN